MRQVGTYAPSVVVLSLDPEHLLRPIAVCDLVESAMTGHMERCGGANVPEAVRLSPHRSGKLSVLVGLRNGLLVTPLAPSALAGMAQVLARHWHPPDASSSCLHFECHVCAEVARGVDDVALSETELACAATLIAGLYVHQILDIRAPPMGGRRRILPVLLRRLGACWCCESKALARARAPCQRVSSLCVAGCAVLPTPRPPRSCTRAGTRARAPSPAGAVELTRVLCRTHGCTSWMAGAGVTSVAGRPGRRVQWSALASAKRPARHLHC